MSFDEKEGKLRQLLPKIYLALIFSSFFIFIQKDCVNSLWHFLYSKCYYKCNYMEFYYSNYLLLCALEVVLKSHFVMFARRDSQWHAIMALSTGLKFNFRTSNLLLYYIINLNYLLCIVNEFCDQLQC